MYSRISTISKQAFVWALTFVLILSVVPTAVADEDADEYFYGIEDEASDEDGDGYDDTITIGYDPDKKEGTVQPDSSTSKTETKTDGGPISHDSEEYRRWKEGK